MVKQQKKKQRKRSEPTASASRRAIHEHLFARTHFSRQEWMPVAIVFVLALVVRSIYFYINRNNNPLFYFPMLDALFHHDWAREILSGDFWGREVFFRAPFYAYLLAFLYKLSGSSIAFAVYVQHIIGSLSVVLVYLLARRHFSPRVSLAAGIIAALYWPLIFFEGDLLFETLIVFLDLVLLLILTVAVQRRSGRMLFAAGIVLGLSAVTRPSILILVPVLPLVFHFFPAAREGTPHALRTWLRPTALVVAGSLVFILPVLVRNFVVGHDFVPIASQGGVNFFIGNNSESNGSQAFVPGARGDLYGTYQGAIELAEKDAGRKLKPSEVSNYYTKKALGFIASSPGVAFDLFCKKLYLFWAGIERSNDKYIQFFWKRYGLGRVPLPGFWLVGPLALLGAVLLIRRWREFSLLYLFVLSYMIGVVIFFVNGRFRLPVVPVLIIFASYALLHTYAAVRAKSRDLVRIVPILAVCVFIVDTDYIVFRGVRAFDETVAHYELANAYLKKGDKYSALSEFERANEIQKKYPTPGYSQISGAVDLNIGMMYWEKGLYSRAAEAFERISDTDQNVVARNGYLADCYLKTGRIADAIALYQKSIEQDPKDAGSLFGLGVAYRAAGDLDRSQQALEEAMRVRPRQDGSANFELAKTLELKGDLEGAKRNYEIAADGPTQWRNATLELARLSKKTGDREKALEYFQKLRAAYPDDRTVEMELNALQRGR
jgi:tetratricopeptide (TPR) repeat protein